MPFEITSWSASSSALAVARLGLFGRRRRLAGAVPDQAARPSRAGARWDCRPCPSGSRRRSGSACLRGDARELHRLRVRERRVAARVREDDRIVRRDLVERRVRRKSFDVRLRRRRPLLLVPAAADDPLPWLRLLDRLRRPCGRSRPSSSCLISSRLILPSPMLLKWPWPSMKPGIASWPARSITCVAGPDETLAMSAFDADRHDGAVARGQRLRFRQAAIERDDAPAAQNEIGRLRPARAVVPAADDQAGGQQKSGDGTFFHSFAPLGGRSVGRTPNIAQSYHQRPEPGQRRRFRDPRERRAECRRSRAASPGGRTTSPCRRAAARDRASPARARRHHAASSPRCSRIQLVRARRVEQDVRRRVAPPSAPLERGPRRSAE